MTCAKKKAWLLSRSKIDLYQFYIWTWK